MAKETEHIFLQLNQRLSNVEKIVKKVQRDVDDKSKELERFIEKSKLNIKVMTFFICLLMAAIIAIIANELNWF